MKLSEVIVRSAEAGLKLIDPVTGTMPAGHNGLKHDPETPVRNTGQWSITFFKAYEISGDQQFHAAAVQTIDYLFTRDARPMGATFWHRKNPHKDACNGVLGTAFSTEALMVAHRATGDDRYEALAAEVFRLHPFDFSARIWKRVNVDGSYPRGRLYSFDLTFNHQLWLAMAGSMIDPEAKTEVGTSVGSFLDGLLNIRSFSVSSAGRIIDEVFITGNWGDRAIYLGSSRLSFSQPHATPLHGSERDRLSNLFTLCLCPHCGEHPESSPVEEPEDRENTCIHKQEGIRFSSL